jgi:hypothetical protein
MDTENKNKYILFVNNFLKFITDKKTLISSLSFCVLILLLIIFTTNTTFNIEPSYRHTQPLSLFSNRLYDL